MVVLLHRRYRHGHIRQAFLRVHRSPNLPFPSHCRRMSPYHLPEGEGAAREGPFDELIREFEAFFEHGDHLSMPYATLVL
jgi:hypothetical protein